MFPKCFLLTVYYKCKESYKTIEYVFPVITGFQEKAVSSVEQREIEGRFPPALSKIFKLHTRDVESTTQPVKLDN